MENIKIRNIVIFKPKGADFCHSLAYKELGVQHLDENVFLNFEYKGNRIASFDSEQQPSLSVETETITGTTTLSLQDNKPVVVIQGRINLLNFTFLRNLVPYSTVPVTSGYAEGMRICFQPAVLSKHPVYRYNIVDEQRGVILGILLIPASGKEMTLAFEDVATETQKRIMIGVSAFIIADSFRIKQMAEYSVAGIFFAFFAIFLIYLYFLDPK